MSVLGVELRRWCNSYQFDYIHVPEGFGLTLRSTKKYESLLNE